MNTVYGEFMDLIACMDIYNGRAEQKKKRDFLEIMEMR